MLMNRRRGSVRVRPRSTKLTSAYIPWLSKTFLHLRLRLARRISRHCCTALSSPRSLRQKRDASREHAACSCLVPKCWASADALPTSETTRQAITVKTARITSSNQRNIQPRLRAFVPRPPLEVRDLDAMVRNCGSSFPLKHSYSACVGTIASMITPPSPDATVKVPPSARIRSRIPVKPRPNFWSGFNPRPLSQTRTSA